MSLESNRQISPDRSSLEVLYPDPADHSVEDAEVDIIAVHGLGSNVDWSWTWKDKNKKGRYVHWLKDPDMLPALLPKARILVYNYESRWHANAPETRLQLCGESLIHCVHNFRMGSQRPIIFLGHSLGGLVILYGLLYAESEEEFRYLPRQTVGFVSLGTPFRGTQMKWIAIVIAWLMALVYSHVGIIRDLGYDNSTLRDKVHDLCKLRDKLHLPTCCFFEEYKTDYGKKFGVPGLVKAMVVKEESAHIAGWERSSLPADHLQMNKYSGPNDSSFLSVSAVIVKMYNKAKDTIESRRSLLDRPQFMVPFGRNRGFVGREQTLRLLRDKISPGVDQDDCQRVALEGLGGVGKSQLALEAAYRVRSEYPELSVFWVPAISEATFDNAYREIAQQLGLKELNDDQADMKPLTKAALEKDSVGKWLFILDGADDVQLLLGDRNSKGLAQYLPFNRNGSILVTTRTREVSTGLDISQKNITKIQEMSEDEAFQFLQNELIEDQLRDRKSACDLLELLAYLPLAIKQAAAYMAKTGMVTTKYLDHCRKSNSTLIKLLSKNFEDCSRYKDTSNPVATTWLISFEHISRDTPLAAEYLKQLCFFEEKDIPLILLKQDSELEADEAIGVLKGYAFITEREGTSFDIHRLVRLAMRNWIKEQGSWEEWITKGIRYLESGFLHIKEGDIITLRKYLPHTQTALEFQQDALDKEATWRLLFNTSKCYRTLGYYEKAEQTARESLDLAEKIFGHEHLRTLLSTQNLAIVLQARSKYPEAGSLNQELLQLYEKLLGPNHPGRLMFMNNLAFILELLGKLNEAEEIHRQVLEMRKGLLGENHGHTFPSMEDLDLSLLGTGKDEMPEKLWPRALKSHNESQQLEPIDIQRKNVKLAIALADKGKHSEAEEILQQGLDVMATDLGVNHPETLDVKGKLFEVLMRQRRYREAEIMSRGILGAAMETMGLESHLALASMSNLASALFEQGKYQEAESIYRQQLELRKRLIGEESPLTIDSLGTIAFTLWGQNKYEEAELILRQVLELREEVLGKEHPSTIWALGMVARLIILQNKYEEAVPICQQALELQRKVLGKEDPGMIDNLYQQTLETRRGVSGKKHLKTLQDTRQMLNMQQCLKGMAIEFSKLSALKQKLK
ncbi:TPR-like protein [Daldinia vernicosa]|uniref:TPR-like protein n=1 Tax=Daldinia vernicosa TaxID=114800 RepID=UPI00200899DD|nr:TPR-like protein [Daldinia vernicosa]KAI0849478.1 TPR-like protein [Daldinia vernicosa]